jgi:hypothetical protein
MARRPKQHDNSMVCEHLEGYLGFSYFKQGGSLREVTALDDILTGVACLDHGGNTRSLSKSTLFSLLATLPVITSDTVRDAVQCSQSHARRLAVALRIASSAFSSLIAPVPLSGLKNYAHL